MTDNEFAAELRKLKWRGSGFLTFIIGIPAIVFLLGNSDQPLAGLILIILALVGLGSIVQHFFWG